MASRIFAPEFSRNEDGWILFPRDTGDRKNLFFPEESFAHPAKMNFHLTQAIIEFVAGEGDTIIDPFGGTGTTMIAALQGMKVILIEIEDGYHNLEMRALENLRQADPEAADRVILLQGDNRFLLPIPCNHVVTSPPYSNTMKISKVRKRREDAPDDWLVEQDERMLEYSKSPRNLSKLNTFMYNQAMEKVYNLCYQSLVPGGTMTTVVKDRIDNGKRVYLSKWVDKVCKQAGFEPYLWEKWKAPGHGFTNIARSQGKLTVQDEDIMIYRRIV